MFDDDDHKEKPMHVLVTDSETDELLIDADLDGDTPAEAPDAVGTHTGPTTMYGPVYHGVKVWVAPKNTVHPWEDAEPAVFVQWADKSNTRDGRKTEIVHTLERPLPGGAMGRFLVTVS
jgi:hypothetical protein